MRLICLFAFLCYLSVATKAQPAGPTIGKYKFSEFHLGKLETLRIGDSTSYFPFVFRILKYDKNPFGTTHEDTLRIYKQILEIIPVFKSLRIEIISNNLIALPSPKRYNSDRQLDTFEFLSFPDSGFISLQGQLPPEFPGIVYYSVNELRIIDEKKQEWGTLIREED